mmetsp:Transcript_11939/g.25951  ORF Transcript_11939/g.25951 Transcript_11939/m.25951 type:complete len:213 (+) Transcript_11939:643-1281(+)
MIRLDNRQTGIPRCCHVASDSSVSKFSRVGSTSLRGIWSSRQTRLSSPTRSCSQMRISRRRCTRASLGVPPPVPKVAATEVGAATAAWPPLPGGVAKPRFRISFRSSDRLQRSRRSSSSSSAGARDLSSRPAGVNPHSLQAFRRSSSERWEYLPVLRMVAGRGMLPAAGPPEVVGAETGAGATAAGFWLPDLAKYADDGWEGVLLPSAVGCG